MPIVATAPSTRTRPARIRSSALRRGGTPAPAPPAGRRVGEEARRRGAGGPQARGPRRDRRAIDPRGVPPPRQNLPPLRNLDQLAPVVAGRERTPGLRQRAAPRRRARLRVE